MATPKKKHLIQLMIEAGVKWPDGAEYAAQDKCSKIVNFYSKGKPDDVGGGLEQWMANNCEYLEDEGIELPSLCRNWHQTIVTRWQHAEALAASVAQDVQQEEQPTPEYCASVMRQMPDNTIEQLTSDYHAKAAEADRLQSIADEALKAADDALLALEKAGELIGLVISIDKNLKQPVINDWRDLRVGDVVEHVEHNGGSAIIGSHGAVSEALDQCIVVDYPEHNGYVYSVPECQHKFRFIRRP